MIQTIHSTDVSNEQRLVSAVTPSASLRHSTGLKDALSDVEEGRALPPISKRTASDEELAGIATEIVSIAKLRAKELLSGKKVKEARGNTQRIVEILLRGSMNRPSVVPDAPARQSLESQVARATDAGGTLAIAIPLGGGKAPVPLKTAGVNMPDNSERLMLAHFAALVEAVRDVYPRTSLLMVPDAPLHEDFGFDPAIVASHVERLRRMSTTPGFDGMIHVADTAGLIPTDLYGATIEDGEHEVLRRARLSVTEAGRLVEQARSLQFIVRPPRMDLDDAVRFYGALVYGTADLSLRQEVEHFRERVNRLTLRMAAVNSFGLREPIGLVRRAVEAMFGTPLFVRATVHAKPGEIRPMLRAPSALDSPGLLPMHGLAFRVTDQQGQARWGMTFAIDARMRRWTAVYNKLGEFQHFEAAGVSAVK